MPSPYDPPTRSRRVTFHWREHITRALLLSLTAALSAGTITFAIQENSPAWNVSPTHQIMLTVTTPERAQELRDLFTHWPDNWGH